MEPISFGYLVANKLNLLWKETRMIHKASVAVRVDPDSPFKYDQGRWGWGLEQDLEGVPFGHLKVCPQHVSESQKPGICRWENVRAFARNRGGYFSLHHAEKIEALFQEEEKILQQWVEHEVACIPFFATQWRTNNGLMVPVLSLWQESNKEVRSKMGFRTL